MHGGREWKSQAAEQVKRMGGDGEEVLFGPGTKQRPMDEMTSSQLREEGKRRAARPRPEPKSRLRRLLAWFNL